MPRGVACYEDVWRGGGEDTTLEPRYNTSHYMKMCGGGWEVGGGVSHYNTSHYNTDAFWTPIFPQPSIFHISGT